jgi:hypothetical protein
MSLHIYTAPGQPATDWTDNNGETPIKGGWRPHQRARCDTCGEVREMRHLTVQLFYDSTYFHCVEGHEHQHGDRRRRLVHCKAKTQSSEDSPRG